MSVKMSMNARGLSESVGRPGLGSSARRTDPMVGRPPLAAFAAVGMAVSLMPGTTLVNTLGWNPVVSSR